MTDHLVDRGNLREVGIAIIVGRALAALVGMVSGCSPQQSAQLAVLQAGYVRKTQ